MSAKVISIDKARQILRPSQLVKQQSAQVQRPAKRINDPVGGLLLLAVFGYFAYRALTR